MTARLTDAQLDEAVSQFERLKNAARKLLASRYRDGEADAVAMAEFASVFDDVDEHAGHRLVTTPGDETFRPLAGCLDCDVWFGKPVLR